ncbi:MAG: hypothetical protein R3F61_25975 [Myxococcota bacterium]
MSLLALLVAPAWSADVLPVRRIRFYETGVGWFEREGVVDDTTSLPVPTSHLDDALKSLVVLGGDVDLGAITFPTALGDDAARVNAGLPHTEEMSFQSALQALLGVSVALETPDRRIEGVLIDVSGPLDVVNATESATSEVLAPEYALTVLGHDGVLHRTTTKELRSLRSGEAEVTDRMATAARTMARTRAQRPNALDVKLRKGGRLGLGYLAEAPVWRVSYRVLDKDGSGADLQAWALVHNDTDEAWKGVRIELANGEPDSFLYPMAAPRYAERDLKTPPVQLATVSQLATSTPDEMWNDSGQGSYGVGMSGTGVGGGGSAYGMGGVGTFGSASVALKTAEPVETPTQFVYRVPQPVDLPAHHSALVPIVQEGVPAEPATVFEPHSTVARSGMWLENGTNRTLPAGVLSVLQAGGLAGESELARLKPGETQMVTFGNELDVDLARGSVAGEVRPHALDLRKDRIVLQSVTPTVHTFDVRNRSGAARSLWLALELTPNEEIETDVRSEIDLHTGWTWLVLPFEPGSTDQRVTTHRSAVQSLEPATIAESTWLDWADRELADPDVLRAAARTAATLADLDTQLAGVNAERDRAKAELTGLRASLTAADGSNSAHPLTRRAATVESEIRRLDGRESQLRDTRAKRAEELLAVLAPLADDAAVQAD